MEVQLASQLIKAATLVEQKLDDEINKLDKLDDDGLEEIRRKRLAEMQKAQQKKQELQSSGHGALSELAGDGDFLAAAKRAPKMVCFFYGQQTEKCQAVDKCLENLARANFFTRFVRVNTERCPFLVERLRLTSIPVIGVVKNEKICDYIRLADKLEQGVEALESTIEQKLNEAGAIEKTRPAPSAKATAPRRNIRGNDAEESD